MPSFNLIDEPWLPCLPNSGDPLRQLGLRETLVQAPTLREVVDPSPLVTAALHRLLLAILHRVYGPASLSDWARYWSAGAGHWDAGKLDDYFATWRPRFDLFHPERPFYQVATLDPSKAVSAAKLTHELAAGNNPTLFDHTTPDKVAFTPAEAARYLVACQAFAVGGLVSFEDAKHRSADGAPLVKGALALVKGENLFQTLMLNLHRYDPAHEIPFPCRGDLPAWERDEQTRPEDRRPAGYLDLLTWQSRSIRLLPETDADGRTIIRQAVIMKGYQFPDGFHRYGRETMVAFVKNEKPQPGQEPWTPVGFQPDRALWRDSLALLQSVAEKRSRPKMLDWLGELVEAGELARAQTLPVDLLGLASDRATVLFWRHERLPLPLAYLGEKKLVDALGQALERAERVAKALQTATRLLAKHLARAGETNGARLERDIVEPSCGPFSPGRNYWARLEVPFRQLVVDLAQDVALDADGDLHYGTRALPRWAQTLRGAAVAAFAKATDGLDTSTRAIRALALAEREFHRRLSQALADHTRPRKEEDHAAGDR